MIGDGVGRAAFTVTDSGTSVELAGDVEQPDQARRERTTSPTSRTRSPSWSRPTRHSSPPTSPATTTKARSLYASTRAYYERIEPTAESFGDLDPEDRLPRGGRRRGRRVDRLPPHREGPLAAGRAQLGGYVAAHPASSARTSPTSSSADVQQLHDVVNAEDFTVSLDAISNGAIGLLDEVATGKITGEEEFWSHTDLWDFQANVEGAEVAFGSVRDIARRPRTPRSSKRSTPSSPRWRSCSPSTAASRRLRVLQRAHARPRARARRRRQRPRRAALQAHRSTRRMTAAAVPRPPVTAPMPQPDTIRTQATQPHGLSRRGLLGLAGAGVVGAGIGVGRRPLALPHDASAAPGVAASYPFYGEHQAGITTPAQDRLHFAAFDVADISRDDLIELLQDWTARGRPHDAGPRRRPGRRRRTARSMHRRTTPARPSPARRRDSPSPSASARPCSGRTAPTASASPRKRPAALDRPAALRRRRARTTSSSAATSASRPAPTTRRWPCTPSATSPGSRSGAQPSAGRSSASGAPRRPRATRSPPRNLFGFKDGTANIKAEDTATVDEHVWVPAGDRPRWMAGGCYLVARKIRMIIETWDRTSLREQERIIGRDKGEGAPLTGGSEFTEPDFAQARHGRHADHRPDRARAAGASEAEQGRRLLRRGYNFVDGNDEPRPPRRRAVLPRVPARSAQQFVPIQRSPRRARRAERVHPARRLGDLRGAARARATGSYVGAPLFDAEQPATVGDAWSPCSWRPSRPCRSLSTTTSDAVRAVREGRRAGVVRLTGDVAGLEAGSLELRS